MKKISITFVIWLFFICEAPAQNHTVVFQSDFGLKDGAVAAMKGVALTASDKLKLFDLTHEIPAYNIWEASYRLNQTARYWPVGTVFVSIVDPGVGSERKSIVMKSHQGPYYFVTPDNGTLTLIAESLGIAEVREIDERKNRLPGSADSYTFHGRDVFAYTAARLASGTIKFEEVGAVMKQEPVRIAYTKPTRNGDSINGTIDILDIQYGNVWTNIDKGMIANLGLTYGDWLVVKIFENGVFKRELRMPYAQTFSAVKEGEPVAYLNSLLNFSFGLNMDNLAIRYDIKSGPAWTVSLSKQR